MEPNALQTALRDFARKREWEPFHNPKNLVMALSGEVGELTELFQWLTEAESGAVMATPAVAARVREEVADVYLYLLRLADVLDIDLEAAGHAKIAVNQAKYPEDLARGTALKYDQLRRQPGFPEP